MRKLVFAAILVTGPAMASDLPSNPGGISIAAARVACAHHPFVPVGLRTVADGVGHEVDFGLFGACFDGKPAADMTRGELIAALNATGARLAAAYPDLLAPPMGEKN